MSIESLIWVIASAACWAAADALRKHLAGHVAPAPLTFMLTLGSLPAFAALNLLEPWTHPEPGFWLPSMASFAGNLAATVLMLRALAIADLAVAVPMLAWSPVFSALLGWGLLGEQPTGQQWIGVALVVLGAVGLQLQGRRLHFDKGALMMVGVAALFASTGVADKAALQHGAVGQHGSLQMAGMALAMGAFVVFRGRAHELRPPVGQWRWVILATLAFSGAFAAQLIALMSVNVSTMETVKRAVGVTSAGVIGKLVFGETLGVARIVGIGLMGVGAALVLL